MSWISRLRPWVEVGRGLVEHEYGRIAGEHASKADALALAEAQVMRRTIGQRPQVDAFQAIECDPPCLGRGLSQVERSERDILDDRVAKKLVVGILKHQSDPPADLGCVAIVDFQAVDPYARSPARLAAVGRVPPRWPWPAEHPALWPARGRSSAKAACSCPRHWARPTRPTRRNERSVRRPEALPCRRDNGTPARSRGSPARIDRRQSLHQCQPDVNRHASSLNGIQSSRLRIAPSQPGTPWRHEPARRVQRYGEKACRSSP